jgi:type IV pilus assembly protein PilB
VLDEGGFPAAFDLEAYEPTGCRRCANTGYKGRVGLYEVMVVSEDIRKLVLERAPADQIARVAVDQGMRRLRTDGLEKVKQGRTSISEVVRVTGSAGSAD